MECIYMYFNPSSHLGLRNRLLMMGYAILVLLSLAHYTFAYLNKHNKKAVTTCTIIHALYYC